MTPEQAANSALLSANTVTMVVTLLTDSHRQLQELTDVLREATASLDIDGCQHARELVIEAVRRVHRVKLLVAEIDDWTFGQDIGFVADQRRSVIEALESADAEFLKAAKAFATARVR